MKLDMVEIAKEVFKDKELFVEELPDRKVKFYIKLRTDFRNDLFNKLNGITQKNIAVLINSTQGNVSGMIRGNRPIELNQLKTLYKYANTDFKLSMKNTQLIKIYHMTPIQISENFLSILV